MIKIAQYALSVSLLTVGAATAQTAESGSNATSGSQSFIYQEGSAIPKQSPGMAAPGLMHTGPCIVSTSGALSGPGVGVSLGGGRLDEACDTRAGAAALAAVVGPRAAAEHLCLDPKMRSTLEPLGVCTVHRSATQPAPETARAAPMQTAYRACRFEEPSAQFPGGRIHLSVRRGDDRATAEAQCRAVLGK